MNLRTLLKQAGLCGWMKAKWLGRLLCALGWHRWVYGEDSGVVIRACKRCCLCGRVR